MFFDDFRLDTLTVQVQYKTAFEIWDRAGAVARAMSEIWPELELIQGSPQQQVLKGKGVQIQTGHQISTLVLLAPVSLDQQTILQVRDSFEVWKRDLALGDLSRVSTRGVYASERASIADANTELRKWLPVMWPSKKVFDQPEDSEKNSVELGLKYEDDKSFSFLRFRTEQLNYEIKLERPFESPEKKVVSRMIVDFDRGLVGTVKASTFRMDEWLKGFQHVLRRDIGKVLDVP